MSPVLIVGAGIAGLACARTLHRAGRPFLLFEAAKVVGGRVRSDITSDGFILDRGFQVLLSAYPEVRNQVDTQALLLRPFRSGAVIRLPDGRETILPDPFQKPAALTKALFSPVGTLADKLRIAALAADVCLRSPEKILAREGMPTERFLREKGWSERMIECFFRPFFGGVFLDRSLQTHSSFFQFVFQQFLRGSATLPAFGMQSIPDQIAAELPPERLHLGMRVAAVERGAIALDGWRRVEGSAVVVAVDGARLGKLLPGYRVPETWNQTTCNYFAAQRSPGKGDGYLRLNAGKHSLAHNVCFPSDVASGYAPDGQTLVSVSTHGAHGLREDQLVRRLRQEMEEWFGAEAADWRHLGTYEIPLALPRSLDGPKIPTSHLATEGIFVCGDHTAYPSLNAALASGRATASEILATR